VILYIFSLEKILEIKRPFALFAVGLLLSSAAFAQSIIVASTTSTDVWSVFVLLPEFKKKPLTLT
jgi:hypothetical protein